MILRGLDLLADEPGVNDTAAQAFATLSGRDSRSFPADRYVRGQRVETSPRTATAAIRASGGIGEAVYALGVARPGDYRLRLHVAGAGAPAEAEITRAGDGRGAAPLLACRAAAHGAGSTRASCTSTPAPTTRPCCCPRAATLEYVELAPPCVHPIEPRGGWKADGRHHDRGRRGDRAAGARPRVASCRPRASPLEFHGSDMQLEDGRSRRTPAASTAASAAARAARASCCRWTCPRPGSTRSPSSACAGGGQRWLADGCRTCVVCPSTDAAPALARRSSRASSQKGPHVFAARSDPAPASSGSGSSRRRTAADYVGDRLRDSASSSGPAGPVTRERPTRRAASWSGALAAEPRAVRGHPALGHARRRARPWGAGRRRGGGGEGGGGRAAARAAAGRGRRWRRRRRMAEAVAAAEHPATSLPPFQRPALSRRLRREGARSGRDRYRLDRAISPSADGRLSTPRASRADTRQR